MLSIRLMSRVEGYSDLEFYNLKNLNILISKVFLILAGFNMFFWFYFSKLVEYDEKQTRILTFSFIYLIIVSFSHYLLSTKLISKIYYSDISHESNRFRWLEYSLTSSIMVIIYAMLIDITNPTLLILFFIFNSSSMIIAGFGDIFKYSKPKYFWTLAAISGALYISQWLVIFSHAVKNFNNIEISNILIVSYMFVTFLFFPLLYLLQLTPYFKNKYTFIEKYFMTISLLSKTLLLFSLFFLI